MTLPLGAETFYDMVPLVFLAQIAVRVGFQSASIALEVSIFIGLRYLQERTILSEKLWPTRPLIASSPRGVGLAKLSPKPARFSTVVTSGHQRRDFGLLLLVPHPDAKAATGLLFTPCPGWLEIFRTDIRARE